MMALMKVGAVEACIEQVRDEDSRAPRKQPLNARQIPAEFSRAAVALSTLRNYVRAGEHALGW